MKTNQYILMIYIYYNNFYKCTKKNNKITMIFFLKDFYSTTMLRYY